MKKNKIFSKTIYSQKSVERTDTDAANESEFKKAGTYTLHLATGTEYTEGDVERPRHKRLPAILTPERRSGFEREQHLPGHVHAEQHHHQHSRQHVLHKRGIILDPYRDEGLVERRHHRRAEHNHNH